MRVFKRIGVLSLARAMGAGAAGVSFVMGLGYASILAVVGLVRMARTVAAGGKDVLVGTGFSVSMALLLALGVVLVPLVYGLFAFLLGLVHGAILNLALRLSGGIEYEVTEP